MDDILITGNDFHALSQLVVQLHMHFDLKDLGPLGYFLGIEVTTTFDQLHFC